MKTTVATLAVITAMEIGCLTGWAAALYWDADGGTITPVGGTGTWDLVDATWRPTQWNGTPLQAWVNSNNAHFYSLPGTVTLGADVIVGQLQFMYADYTIDGPFALTVVGGVGSSTVGGGTGTINVPVIMNLDVQFRNSVTFNGNISDDGGNRNLGHYFDTLTLNGSNSFGGGVRMFDASVLVVGHDHALGPGVLTLFDGTVLEAGGGDRTVANTLSQNWVDLLVLRGTNNLTFSSPQALKSAWDHVTGPSYNVVETNTVLTFGGLSRTIYKSGMTKEGAGTFVIDGTYKCAMETWVNAGALILNGTTVAPDNGYGYTVAGGATLGGTGTINLAASGSTCTVQQAGALAPGAMGVGTLTINGDVSMAENTIYRWEYQDSTGDLVDVNGTLTLPSVTTVLVSQVSGALPASPTLFTFDARTGAGSVDGWVAEGYTVEIDGNSVVLVPPPGGLSSFCVDAVPTGLQTSFRNYGALHGSFPEA